MVGTKPNLYPTHIISTAATTVTAAQAAAAAGRDMKNFSDLEINDLLGLIPDEYTAKQQAADEAATAAANAASASGRGVHHSVTVPQAGVPSISKGGKPSDDRHVSGSSCERQLQSGVSTNSYSSVDPNAQDDHVAAQEAQLRSERKRSREKQRRNDVNKQFAELTEVLKKIEREAQEVSRNDDAYGNISTMMAIAANTGPTNRVDLIARTIVHLERLNQTAKKQRVDIQKLHEQLECTKKAGEDTAEKLKDIMFNQQQQFTTAKYAPFPHVAPYPTPATSARDMNQMTATSNAPRPQLQQQLPMMMIPMIVSQSTAPTPSPAGVSTGTPAAVRAPGVSSNQQETQQQLFMAMHPGAAQQMQQAMHPIVVQSQQPVPQQSQYVQQVHLQQQQQQQPVQHQPYQPITPKPAGQECLNGGKIGSSNGENFAHAA